MRPSNLTFGVYDSSAERNGRSLRAGIKNAHVEKTLLPSVPLDFVVENDNLYEIYYERMHEAEFDAEWNWPAIVSFQKHRNNRGQYIYYAVARPYKASKPSVSY